MASCGRRVARQGLAARLDSASDAQWCRPYATPSSDTIRVTCTPPREGNADELLADARNECGEMRGRRPAAAAEHARAARGPPRRELGEAIRRYVLAAPEPELVLGHAEVRVD